MNEMHEIYTCTGCGYTSRKPLRLEVVEECRWQRHERRLNYVRLGMVIVACVTLPFLISALLALIP
jgi:hypothetical protein